jgi:hypothetical protein
MIRILVEDNEEKNEVSVTFTFGGRDADELGEARAVVEMARGFAPSQTRLDVEMGAHAAYFREMENGIRAWSVPPIGTDTKGKDQ